MERSISEDECETNGEYLRAKLTMWIDWVVNLISGHKYEKM